MLSRVGAVVKNFSVKCQIVNIHSQPYYNCSVLRHCIAKAAIDDAFMEKCGCVSVKLYRCFGLWLTVSN